MMFVSAVAGCVLLTHLLCMASFIKYKRKHFMFIALIAGLCASSTAEVAFTALDNYPNAILAAQVSKVLLTTWLVSIWYLGFSTSDFLDSR